MQIENKPVAELRAAAYNPRKDLKPGDAEYEKLKRSIEEFGYVEPVIWNKRTGTVVGGHQRLKVMKDLGYEDVDCVVVDLNENKEQALNVALNKRREMPEFVRHIRQYGNKRTDRVKTGVRLWTTTSMK